MSDNDISISTVETIRKFEQAIINLPQVDLQTAHLIHGGMYARTVFIPAGAVVTGALMKLDNICIVNGDITVTIGDEVRRLVGFNVLPAKKGNKRAVYAHADTYWTTLIHTTASTYEQAENEATDETSNLQTRRAGIEYDWYSKARADYQEFIREVGLPLDYIDSCIRRTDNVVETSECGLNMTMEQSMIHGFGLFANRDIEIGERIAPARRNNNRCIAGRFTNHSHEPNALFVPTGIGDHVDMIAAANIKSGTEITIDYRASAIVALTLATEV